MINQGLVNELVLIDVNQDKAEGEALDLLDGISWAQENIIIVHKIKMIEITKLMIIKANSSPPLK